MNSLESVLNMIATEAFEDAEGSNVSTLPTSDSFEYDLELIKEPNGSLVWKE